jgi:hypothetical protein
MNGALSRAAREAAKDASLRALLDAANDALADAFAYALASPRKDAPDRAFKRAFGWAFRRAFIAALSCEFPGASYQFPVRRAKSGWRFALHVLVLALELAARSACACGLCLTFRSIGANLKRHG